MNLTISQDNSRTETINSSIIDKLYEIAFAASSDPNSTVSLKGRLESPKGYKYKIDWLNEEFGPDLIITVPSSGQYIYFEDDAVLSALVSAGVSSDGVGISADDLLVPTNLSQLGLSGNSNISSFTELSKFVNIRNNSTNFDGCTNLEWISLPNNDGNINVSFFISGGKKLKWAVPSVEFACSKEFNQWYNNPARGGGSDTAWTLYDLDKQPIDDVIIPEGVTSIGKYVFGKMSCNSLSIPSTITQIGQNTFENVSVTQGFSLDLPHLTSIGSEAFKNCTGITNVDLTGSTITSIPNSCFNGCTSLTSVTLPSTCLTINQEGFRNCSSLTALNAQNIKTITGFYSLGGVTMSNLVLPAIETIGQRSLSGSNINVLDLGPNLSSIGTQAFWDGSYTIFIFRGTTVPSYATTNTDKFIYNMNNVTIYVPESAINDYKTAWSAMASNIVKIEGSIYDTQ